MPSHCVVLGLFTSHLLLLRGSCRGLLEMLVRVCVCLCAPKKTCIAVEELLDTTVVCKPWARGVDGLRVIGVDWRGMLRSRALAVAAFGF